MKRNRIFAVVLAMVVVFSLSLTVYAHEAVDLDRNGSIAVLVKYDGKEIPGAKFTCVKVGYVEEVKGTESGFHFYRMFDDVFIKDERITKDSAALAKELESIYKANRERYEDYEWTLDSGKDGTVKFNSLKPGLYLLRQPIATPGYSKMDPFLVSVPYAVKDKDGDMEYDYDVTITSKSELEREPEPTKPPITTDDKLPQTGQLNWPVPLLAVSGLAFFILGWVLFMNREKKHER